MDKETFYQDYYTKHYSQLNEDDKMSSRERESEAFLRSVNILDEFERDAKVLDLGCGFGKFSFLFDNKGFDNYLGVDISEEQIRICEEDFPDLSFVCSDIFEFLERTDDNYDIVFVSHVVEHFKPERGRQALKLIRDVLTEGGVLINVMPNADAYFNSSATRFIDLTHETMYNRISFSDQLTEAGFDEFYHKNYNIGGNTLQEYIHKITLFAFELILQALGYSKKKIYTSSMITIARK